MVGHCYYTPLSLGMSFLNICVALAVDVGMCVYMGVCRHDAHECVRMRGARCCV